FAEVLGRHRGALDVPPRPAGPPRALPRRLARLGGLPEREVGRRALARILVGRGAQVLDLAPAQLAVGREGLDGEPHRALARISVPARDELLDEPDDLGHRLRDPRLVARTQEAEALAVLDERGDVAL